MRKLISKLKRRENPEEEKEIMKFKGKLNNKLKSNNHGNNRKGKSENGRENFGENHKTKERNNKQEKWRKNLVNGKKSWKCQKVEAMWLGGKSRTRNNEKLGKEEIISKREKDKKRRKIKLLKLHKNWGNEGKWIKIGKEKKLKNLIENSENTKKITNK